MKHFNPGIVNRYFKIDILLTVDGMFVIFEFKKRPFKLFKRQFVYVGRVYFSKGYPTFEERFDVIQRWAESLDYKATIEKFYESGFKKKPVFHFNREAKIDFNTALEEIFPENLLENSWRKLELDD